MKSTIKYQEILNYLFWIKFKNKKRTKGFNLNLICTQFNMSLYYSINLISRKSINFLIILKMFQNQFYLTALFPETCSEILRLGTQRTEGNLLIIIISWFRNFLDPNIVLFNTIIDQLISITAKSGSFEKSIFLSFYFLVQSLKKLNFYKRTNLITKCFVRHLIAILYSKRHEYRFCILLQKSLLFIHRKAKNVISTIVRNKKKYGTVYFRCRNKKCITCISQTKINIGFSHWIKHCFLCNVRLHNSFTWNISEELNFKKVTKYYSHQIQRRKIFNNINIINTIISYIVFMVNKGDVLSYTGLFSKRNNYSKIINVHGRTCRIKLVGKDKNYPNLNISWHDAQMKGLNN